MNPIGRRTDFHQLAPVLLAWLPRKHFHIREVGKVGRIFREMLPFYVKGSCLQKGKLIHYY